MADDSNQSSACLARDLLYNEGFVPLSGDYNGGDNETFSSEEDPAVKGFLSDLLEHKGGFMDPLFGGNESDPKKLIDPEESPFVTGGSEPDESEHKPDESDSEPDEPKPDESDSEPDESEPEPESKPDESEYEPDSEPKPDESDSEPDEPKPDESEYEPDESDSDSEPKPDSDEGSTYVISSTKDSDSNDNEVLLASSYVEHEIPATFFNLETEYHEGDNLFGVRNTQETQELDSSQFVIDGVSDSSAVSTSMNSIISGIYL